MKCRFFERCGACSLLASNYDEQLSWKRREVEKAFFSLRIPIEVKPVVGMDQPSGYRNKVIVYVTSKNGRTVSGMYEENSHHIIPTSDCQLHNPGLNEVLCDIMSLLNKLKIKPYGFGGVLKNILLRIGVNTGQVMVVFVTSEDMFHGRNDLVRKLVELHPEVATVVQNTNPRRTSVILGEREKILYGRGFIYDMLLGKRFKISPRSFYQINPVQTEKLYSKALELSGLLSSEGAQKAVTVLDAYCGTGTIGICSTEGASNVIGVEINPDAVRDARANAAANSISNASFYAEDAKMFMKDFRGKVDVLFVDPPRSGCDEEFLQCAIRLAPEKIVYISCNPQTQARDSAVLRRYYSMSDAYPFDMFPQTRHIENIVLFTLRK